MESTYSNTAAGLVELAWGGKLPSMGDFIWSDKSALRAQLDSWLLGGMQQFRLTNDDNWQSGFDSAPIWNFIVPEGVWGQGCVAGCVSPSCDRVGRRFPFTVAYEFAGCLPAWFFSKTINLVPTLLSRTGALLFNGIRRRWLKEALIPLLEQTLINWEKLLPLLEQNPNAPPNDSIIMDILMDDTSDSNAMVTVPNDRFSSFPWGDVTSHLQSESSGSFWWTNGAGNANLKAFNYGTHPDGALLTWLFGRLPA
jgi:type VI secretion system protein ImpM